MKQPHGIILAIESAIGGGSISLLRDTTELGSWVGDTSSVSKAENLLFNIDQLLAECNIDRTELDLIAVSAGPGSFTGIRIGIATALGLKAGLGIKMASESALKAIADHHGKNVKDIFAALPVGRDSICIQKFNHAVETTGPRTLSESAFFRLVDEQREAAFVVHTSLVDRLTTGPRMIDAGANIARSIGLICGINRDVVTEPLFIAKSF